MCICRMPLDNWEAQEQMEIFPFFFLGVGEIGNFIIKYWWTLNTILVVKISNRMKKAYFLT